MPNLEQRIADWRRTMAKASDHRRELLDELETHLREEVERLLRSGVSEEKAFEMALSKLGAPATIAAECDKLTAKQGTWWPVKVARGCAVAAVLLTSLLIFKMDGKGILLASHVWCVCIGYLSMFAIGGLGICYICASWFGGPGPTQRHSLIRSIFQFANVAAILNILGVTLGMFWARENWGRYWAWDPKETAGVLIILWSVLLSALQWFRAGPTTIASFAVLGSALTAAGWFGVHIKLNTGTVSPLLIAVIAIHFVLLASVPGIRLLRKHAVRN